MQSDKVKHFIISFLLTLLGIWWFPMIIVGFLLGLAKEVFHDYYLEEGCFEWADIAYNGLGCYLGTIIVVVQRIG